MNWRTLFSRISKRQPQASIRSYLADGIRLIEEKQFPAAIACLTKAFEIQPDSSEVLATLGAAFMLNGDLNQALTHFEKSLTIDQHNWTAVVNAAHLHVQRGNSDWIISYLDKENAWKIAPPQVAFAYIRYCIEHGLYSKARATLKALRLRLQTHSEYWLQLGVSHQYLNRPNVAEACFRHLQTLSTSTPGIKARHGLLLGECGEYGSARAVTWGALKSSLQSRDCLVAYGRNMEILGDPSTSATAYEKVLEQNPDDTEALTNLGNIKKQNLAFDDAEAFYRKGIKKNPNSAVLHRNLADLLGKTLRAEAAIEELETATSIAPNTPHLVSDLAFAQHYSPRFSATDLAIACKRAGQVYENLLRHPASCSRPKSHGKIRIGLLSGSFRQHPVSFLALPGLEKLDKSRFSLTAFANQVGEDAYTDRFKKLCDRWHSVAHLSDDQLEALIRENRIDILIEMSGHAAGHRLPVVARKVAPMQIKWVGGQFNTMGMACIDFFLSDSVESPEADDTLYNEAIYRLPGSYACYEAPQNAPDVSSLPALTKGHITFGSLNKINKINSETVSLWSRCLTEVPDSRFILQGEPFADSKVRQRLLDCFDDYGISANRIESRPFSPHPDLFNSYNDIDIAMDTFPYSGCLTTCESLWMGVPVVTVLGPTFAGRHSASFLTTAGLAEWIANDADGYVDLAVRKSSDISRLSELRQSLREEVAKSPLCDTQTFGQVLGHALEDMWDAQSDSAESA